MPSLHHVPAGALQNLFPTLTTADSFTALELTATEPTGTNIIEEPSEKVMLFPHGTDAANESFLIRYTAWYRLVPGSGTNTELWYPVKLGEGTCTLGARKGVANTQLGTDVFVCDTVVAVSGGDSNIIYLSPVGDLVAAIIVPAYGAAKIEIEVDRTTAASSGCLATSIS
jgi:hypothetical protein